MKARRTIGITTAILMGSPLFSWAEDDDTKQKSKSVTVEVTATRIPEDIDKLPQAISVVSGEELRARGATDLASALALLGGVDIAPGNDGGPASAVPEIWGLREFDAFLLVVDGVPWGGAFSPDIPTLSLEDVERIEVLRGAAPVMYGATAFVGVIQVIHRAASTEEGTASASAGSYSSGHAAGAFHLGKWADFSSRIELDAKDQGFKDDRTGFRRGHLLWRNSRTAGKGTFHFDVDIASLDQDPSSPHLREGKALSTATPLDANYNLSDAFVGNDRYSARLAYDLDIEPGTWSLLFSASKGKVDVLQGFLVGATEEDPNGHGFRKTVDTSDFYFDTHFAATKWDHVALVVGLDELFSDGKADGGDFDYFIGLDGQHPPHSTPSLGQFHVTDRRSFSGLYGLFAWDPTHRFHVEAGLRLNHTGEHRTAEAREVGGGIASSGTDQRNETRLSGVVGASLAVWHHEHQDVTLFTSYRDTFKPAVVELQAEPGGDGQRILEPENARSVELGLKGRLLDGDITFELAGFRMDFENLVIATVAPSGNPAIQNAGKQRFQGVEGEIAWRIAHDFGLRVSAANHDSRFKDFVQSFDGVPTQLDGNRLEMVPNVLASAGVWYAPEEGLLALVEVAHVGSRFLNKRNTALADAYTTLGASIGYSWKHWVVRADGRNLTDERDPVSESELGDAQYYRLPARRFDAGVTWRF